VDGGSLDKKLAGQPQPARVAARLVETLAQAMHTAHQHHIVHRDLKPANILLQSCLTAEDAEERRERGTAVFPPRSSASPAVKDFTPKITDFGLAKQLHLDQGQTRSGVILGTPSYMAPEQASGSARDVGPAADIYALGV